MTRGLKQDQGFTVQVTVKTCTRRQSCPEKITNKRWKDEEKHGDVKCNTHCNLRTSTRGRERQRSCPLAPACPRPHSAVSYSSPCTPLQRLRRGWHLPASPQLCPGDTSLLLPLGVLHCSHAAAPSPLLLWHCQNH